MDINERLLAERRARLAAERMLELKSRELFAANRKLSEHALRLSDQIIVQRREMASVRFQTEELKGEYSRVRSDLRQAEYRLALALETVTDGFAIYDSKFRLVTANSAFMAVFDGMDEVGPGAHIRDILRIGLEEGVFDPDEEQPDIWVEGLIQRWRMPEIEPRAIRLWNGRHIRLVDKRGTDGGVVQLALDITDTIRRERQLKRARTRAEAASRAKSAFLANMSHELRTPMNGVVGMAELLTETRLTEEQRLYAETIRSSGAALLLIINDVLDFSKLEAARLELRPEVFDLEMLVAELATMLGPAAAEKGLTLAVEFGVELPALVRGDKGRIRQILTNLTGNAVKFTEAGHVAARVRGTGPGADIMGGMQGFAITIEDTGIGIPPDKAEHVFGEFNQVEDDRNRKYEGTGLGLAISRKLARQMGGDITLWSEPGAGSRFTFAVDLPVEAEAPAPAALPVRALVLDPDPVTRSILAGQLRDLGLVVNAAAAAGDLLGLAGKSGGQEPEPGAATGAASGILFVDVACDDLPAALAALPRVRLTRTPATTAGEDCIAVLTRPMARRDLFSALEAAALSLSVSVAPPPAPAEVEPGGPPRLRVLAAEDNRTNQLVFSKMLKDLPVEIIFAENGREAVEAFIRHAPDIVFTDISMPEMDGREATRLIRADEQDRGLPRTPVIALTAHVADADREAFLATGMDGCLSKPFRKAEILGALEQHFPGLTGSAPPETEAEAPVRLATGTGPA